MKFKMSILDILVYVGVLTIQLWITNIFITDKKIFIVATIIYMIVNFIPFMRFKE